MNDKVKGQTKPEMDTHLLVSRLSPKIERLSIDDLVSVNEWLLNDID